MTATTGSVITERMVHRLTSWAARVVFWPKRWENMEVFPAEGAPLRITIVQ